VNQAVHQFLQLLLQGFAWFLKTIESLWTWSWAQIVAIFNISWGNLPAWKLAVGLICIVLLAALLVTLFRRGVYALRRIAAAFWTMALTAFGILIIVVTAGLLSRGVTWMVASVPDNFWDRFL
jgi:hypothetical protein